MLLHINLLFIEQLFKNNHNHADILNNKLKKEKQNCVLSCHSVAPDQTRLLYSEIH